MPNTISVTEAARNFSEVINQVHYQGKTFLLTKGGKIVARLTGTRKVMTGAEFVRLWHERPRLDPEDANLWAEELAEHHRATLPPEERQWDS